MKKIGSVPEFKIKQDWLLSKPYKDNYFLYSKLIYLQFYSINCF